MAGRIDQDIVGIHDIYRWAQRRPGGAAALSTGFFARCNPNLEFNPASSEASPSRRWYTELLGGAQDRRLYLLTDHHLRSRGGGWGESVWGDRYSPARDFDAADCARVRGYFETVRMMLGDEDWSAFTDCMLLASMRSSQPENLAHYLIADWNCYSGYFKQPAAAAAASAFVAAIPANPRGNVFGLNLGSTGPEAAFVAVALVLADAAQGGDWDPYRVGRGNSDCRCALCDGEWPEVLALGPCFCRRPCNIMCDDCPRMRASIYGPDGKETAVDWGAAIGADPASAEAIAHAAESLGLRAAWDERCPAVAAVECRAEWWASRGLHPPQPALRLRFSD